MEDSKSRADDDSDDDQFVDAADDFPFYDCLDGDDFDRSPPNPPSLSQPATTADVSHPPSAVRRRRWSRRIPKDISGNDSGKGIDSKSDDRQKSKIPQNLKKIEKGIENSNILQVGISPERDSHVDEETCEKSTVTTVNDDRDSVHEEACEKSTVTTVNDDRGVVHEEACEKSTVTTVNDDRGVVHEEACEKPTVTTANDDIPNVDSASHRTREEASSSLLISLATLLIKAIGFQMSVLGSIISFPVWLLYSSYMFVVDPFRVVRRARNCLLRKIWGLWGFVFGKVTSFMGDWFKEHKSVWQFAWRCACGVLWASYVCLVLVCMLVSAFVISGFLLRCLVEEPVQLTETLTFDYTKNSPEAYVPLTSCPNESGDIKLGGPRIIPSNHKLQVTLSLTLPESDYNQKLGIFQVKVDFLSANGKTLASANRPCMLHFRSQPIRLLSTFLNAAPLLAGYSTESQTLNVQFRGLLEGYTPTACLRVTIAQRAEFQSRAGLPEIYDASLTLESELPFLKRIIWHWKRTLFIWVGMTVFTTELLLILLCCRPIVMPRGRLRGGAPAP